MILFDIVGDCDLAIPREATLGRGDLYERFDDAAREVNGSDSAAPFEGEIDSDQRRSHPVPAPPGCPRSTSSTSPTATDVRPGEYWHTTEDTLDKVCPESLEAVGEPAVRVLEVSKRCLTPFRFSPSASGPG